MNNLENLSELFKTLSELFSFPEKKKFEKNVFSQERYKFYKYIDIDFKSNFDLLKAEISNTPELELMIEYARLFVGPYSLQAPPYGSYYLEEGRVMGNSTLAVRGLYEFAGTTISDGFKDLPDHIIAELEFLYLLLHNEAKYSNSDDVETLKKIQDLRNIFFNQYFKTWINQFCDLIVEKSEKEFYILLAKTVINLINNINFTEEDNYKMN